MSEVVLICGSRDWADPRPILSAVNDLAAGSTVIVGGARGADALAESYARARDDLTVVVERADWERHGKSAGFIRNRAMVDRNPDRVLAFQRNGSPGTENTITLARLRGIPVEVIA